LSPGDEDADAVAEDGGAPVFVEGDPVFHAVAEGVVADAGVGGEGLGGAVGQPAVVFELEGEREVPVIEGDEGGDAFGE
jgi:hypothetical protein